jgi:hypothetical protein
MFAEAGHQLGRLFQAGPIDMNMILQDALPLAWPAS